MDAEFTPVPTLQGLAVTPPLRINGKEIYQLIQPTVWKEEEIKEMVEMFIEDDASSYATIGEKFQKHPYQVETLMTRTLLQAVKGLHEKLEGMEKRIVRKCEHHCSDGGPTSTCTCYASK